MSLPGVLCVGRVYCDVVFSGLQDLPASGQEVYASDLSMHAGGGAAISASYFASLLDHPNLVSLARSANWTVSLDCAWDMDAMRASAAAVDVFLPNNVEHEKLLQLGWAKRCASITVVKRGEEGATALTDNDSISLAATPVKVVDAIGAGEAFNAGFDLPSAS